MAASGLFLGQYACSPKGGQENEQTAAESTAAVNQETKKVGIQLYTLRNEIQESLEGTIQKVADIGYSWVEGFGYENGRILGKTPQEFQSMLSNMGLTMPSTHAVTELTTSGGKSAIMDAMKKAAEDAKTAGSEYIVYAYLQESERQSMDDYRRHADTFNQFGEICKNVGIQFAYHNHDFEFQQFGDEIAYDYLIENTDPELVKFELDLYWITKAGYDPVEYFDKADGRIELWHVKDMEPGDEKFFAEVGEGTIDFARIFDARQTSGMQYFFVEQDQSRRNPLESIEMSFNHLQQANYV